MAKKTILDLLAEELGAKNKTELKNRLKRSGDMKSRLESGQGFMEALSGSSQETGQKVAENFTKKGMKRLGRKAYMSFFSGDDIFSAYMRGRLNKKRLDKTTQSSKQQELPDTTSPESIGKDSLIYINIIAKQSMSLPGMARDVNVMRQNIQKLVTLWSSPEEIKESKGRPYAQDADQFFMREDEKESALEAGRVKSKSTSPTVVVKDGGEEKEDSGSGGGSFLQRIVKSIASGILKAIRFLFNPKMLLRVFTKVFLPLALIASIFSGIFAGFKKYEETGSLKEAMITGLGEMLSFLTFGLFGEDRLRSLLDSLSEFFAPLQKKITDMFSGIKDFFKNLFGKFIKFDDEPKGKTKEQPGKPARVSLETPVTPNTETPRVQANKKPDEQLIKDWAYSVYIEKNSLSQVPTSFRSPVEKILENVPGQWVKKKNELFGDETDEKPEGVSVTPVSDAKPVSVTPVSDAKPVSESPSPQKVPSTAANQVTENVFAADNKIKIPSGVSYDSTTNTFTYKNTSFIASNQNDLDRIIANIDAGNVSNVAVGGSNTTMNETTNQVSNSVGSNSLNVNSAPNISDMSSTNIDSTNISPEPETTLPSVGGGNVSGNMLSDTSSEIADEQRIESSADDNVSVNSSITNVNNQTVKSPQRNVVSNVYDLDLANMLART